MDYAVPLAPAPILPVLQSEKGFPVNHVYCVGRNYADHAVEMGHDPNQAPPFFFMKPSYAVLPNGGEMQYPAHSTEVHHEVEMVVALGQGGSQLTEAQALDCIFGYAVGIDMTRRDLQAEAKELSRPWDAGKVFLHAAPCSSIAPAASFLASNQRFASAGRIQLEVNGEVRQQGDINQMLWKVPEIIARLSELFPLYPGDLIFTGTPAGVGAIQPGDQLRASLVDLQLNVNVVEGGR